ncbi:MAG: cation transporting ATPase C-terminal domain-containing protein [Deltaproteobacteria bacterium]|nr:cation transporting ATPase C-terminal domain-containing protein [Deltaproteobacteria bacterium]
MKISQIDIFPVRISLKGSFRNAHLAKTGQDSIIVRVLGSEEVEGVGNIDPDPGYSEESFSETLATVRQLAPNLIGSDPLNIISALERMDQLVAGHLDAKAAIEMALFDLKGKALGVPVYSLLGGKVRNEIYLNGWIGILPPEEAAREAQGWVKLGFRSAKIKVGSGIEQDRDRVKAVREAVGKKMALRVDANEAYGVDDAIRLGRLLSAFEISLFEQPVSRHDLNGMAQVRRGIDVPVMADEAVLGPETLIEIIKKEAADIVLLNNSFSIIVAAIEEGRRIIDNLKKIIVYLLSTSFSEIFLISGALIMGAPLPLLPAQILWANIIEEGLMSFPFAFEKSDPHSMERDPRSHRAKNIMTTEVKKLIFMVGFITGFFLIALYFVLLRYGLPIEEIRTLMFVALSVDSIFFAFSLKSFDTPIWKINIFSNKFLIVGLVSSILLLFGALTLSPLQTLLSLTPLTPLAIALLFGIGIFNLLTIEVSKYFLFGQKIVR